MFLATGLCLAETEHKNMPWVKKPRVNLSGSNTNGLLFKKNNKYYRPQTFKWYSECNSFKHKKQFSLSQYNYCIFALKCHNTITATKSTDHIQRPKWSAIVILTCSALSITRCRTVPLQPRPSVADLTNERRTTALPLARCCHTWQAHSGSPHRKFTALWWNEAEPT